MATIRVDFTGIIFSEGSFNEGVEKFTEDMRREAISTAQPLTPVDTGFLRQSWKEGSGVNLAYNDASYAAFVDEGTRNQRGQFFSLKSAERLSDIAPDILERIIAERYS